MNPGKPNTSQWQTPSPRIAIQLFLIPLLLMLLLSLLSACSDSSKPKPKKPGNFFSVMKNIMTGEQGKITAQAEQEIQHHLTTHYPDSHFRVLETQSMASLHSGNWDGYSFTAADVNNVKVSGIWNYYNETLYENFDENYALERQHKTYADTLRSQLPADLTVQVYYYRKLYYRDNGDSMPFYLFLPGPAPATKPRAQVIRQMRHALDQTLQIFGKTTYEATLAYAPGQLPDVEQSPDEIQRLKQATYLASELRSDQSAREIPPLILAGGDASERNKKIQKQLFDDETGKYYFYFFVRQDTPTEYLFVWSERDSTTFDGYITAHFNEQLELVEKKQYPHPVSKGYLYKDILYMIPQPFRLDTATRRKPIETIRPAYDPFRDWF